MFEKFLVKVLNKINNKLRDEIKQQQDNHCPDKVEVEKTSRTGDDIYREVKEEIDKINHEDLDDLIKSFDELKKRYLSNWRRNCYLADKKELNKNCGKYMSVKTWWGKEIGSEAVLDLETWKIKHQKLTQLSNDLANESIPHKKATRYVNMTLEKFRIIVNAIQECESYPSYEVTYDGKITIIPNADWDWSKAHFFKED